MKRYFDIVGKRMTLQIEVNRQGMQLTTEQISAHFDMELREVDRKEYNRLCKEYDS